MTCLVDNGILEVTFNSLIWAKACSTSESCTGVSAHACNHYDVMLQVDSFYRISLKTTLASKKSRSTILQQYIIGSIVMEGKGAEVNVRSSINIESVNCD